MSQNENPDKYPYDGRSARSEPGVIVDLLSMVDIDVPYLLRLNGPLDEAVSRHKRLHPWSPLNPLLGFLFGRRP